MASDAQVPTEETPRTQIERRLGTPTKRIVAVASGISVVIGAFFAVTKLWHDVFPSPKPVAASAKALPRPLLNETLGQFVASNPTAFRGPFTAAQLRTNGDVFTLSLELKGLLGKHPKLSWVAIDGNTTQPLELPADTPTSISLTARSDDDQLTQDVWSPIPGVGDSMFLRFTVKAGRYKQRVADSPVVPIG